MSAAYDSVEVELGTELLGFEQSTDRVDAAFAERSRCDARCHRRLCHRLRRCTPAVPGNSLASHSKISSSMSPGLSSISRSADASPQQAAAEPRRNSAIRRGPRPSSSRPGNHRRFEIVLLPGEDPREMETAAQVWRLLARWITPDDATLWRAASYRFHALVAQGMATWPHLPCRRCRTSAAALHRPGYVPGHPRCRQLVWKLDRVLRGQSNAKLLDSYGEERGEHVRQLTSRIKAIGHVICERDPDAAAARDERVLAEGGGHPRTITRQEIVPPLQTGLLAFPLYPAHGNAVSTALDQDCRRTAPSR